MQASQAKWTAQERQIVQTALEMARSQEINGLIQWVREEASKVNDASDVWRLNDFLSARRFDIDGKYDDSEDEILFVLARLVKEGWLHTDNLKGLEESKLTKIAALTRIL